MTLASFGMVARYPQVLLLPLGTLITVTLMVVLPTWYLLDLLQRDAAAFGAFFKNLFWIPVGMWEEGNYGGAVSAFIIEMYVLQGIWLWLVTSVVLFFQTAAMHTGTMIVKRQEPSLLAGLGVAWDNKWRLLALAFVSAAILTAIRYYIRNTLRLLPIVGKWIYRGIVFTVTAGVYLVLPVLVYERNGAWSAVKRSAHLLKETWGGILVGTGLSFTAMYMVALLIPVGILEFWLDLDIDGAAFGIYAVVLWAFLYCLNQSLSAMLRAALYWYATTGEVPQGVSLDFVPKPKNAGAMLPAATAPADQ